MASIQDLTAAIDQEKAKVGEALGVVGVLAPIVAALVARVGTVPDDVQAGIDDAVAKLAGINEDTTALEQQLGDITATASGTPAPEPEPTPDGPTV